MKRPLSHIVEIKTQLKDMAAVQTARRRLKLPEPQQRTVMLFSSEVTWLAVQSEKCVDEHEVRIDEIVIYGHESNSYDEESWR